jgi:hypothetical protein
MDQETLDTLAVVEEKPPTETPAEVDAAPAEATEEQGDIPEEPPAPRIPKKRAPRVTRRPSPVVIAPPVADPQFWSDMIMTKRELDREATRSRYANLVKF